MIGKLYRTVYNLACAAGWAYVNYLIAAHFAAGGKHEALYPIVEQPLKIVQTVAIMEIFHAAFGIVKSSVFTTTLQVFSRIAVLWGITHVSPPSQVHWAFSLMAASWAAVEVPRYMYYVLNEFKAVPSWLTWLRYSLFIVLYPTGITGELGELLSSMSYIRDHRVLHAELPNTHNLAFNYYYALFAMLAAYIPGSYIMYTHMLRQRRSQLSGVKKDAAAAPASGKAGKQH